MSVQNVLTFRQKVKDDPDLQRQILGSVQTHKSIDAVALGSKYGFEFSQADIHEVLNQDSLELSEFELEVVSAGGVASYQNVAGGCESLVTPPNSLPNLNPPTNVGFQ